MRGRRQFSPHAAILILALLAGLPIAAQEDGALRAEGRLVVERGLFGLPQTLVRGTVSNQGERAHGDIRIAVLAYDATGALLGEGEGYLTRACGAALTDYSMPPGAKVNFVAPLDLQSDAAIARHQILVKGQLLDQAEQEPDSAFRRTTSGEVVVLEWLSPTRLRYAKGCATAPFTDLSWREYDLSSGDQIAIEHPFSAHIDEDFRAASGINRYTQSGARDEELFANSFLRSHHQARRVVFQNDLGHLMTAELNGSYPRLVDESSFRNSLQGIDWLGEGRFLAYTYGAFGDAVHYVSAHIDGARLSGPIMSSQPSQTRPGASNDGLLFVLGLASANPPGYYLKFASGTELQLLYATPLPGNNAPAPIIFRNFTRRLIYIVVPSAGEASWQLVCVNRNSADARTLTNLPIHLPMDERAWFALSPDGRTLALAADGGRGGLWLLDLPATPC